MNLALACDVRLAGAAGPVRHPLPAARHPPRRRPHLDAAPHRRPAGGRGHGAVRRGARRRRGRAGRAGVALRRRRRAARRPRTSMAGPGRGRRRRELVRRIKATIARHGRRSTTTTTAVERELEPQVWSIDQPEFAERLGRPAGQDQRRRSVSRPARSAQCGVQPVAASSSSRRSSHSSAVMA